MIVVRFQIPFPLSLFMSCLGFKGPLRFVYNSFLKNDHIKRHLLSFSSTKTLYLIKHVLNDSDMNKGNLCT